MTTVQHTSTPTSSSLACQPTPGCDGSNPSNASTSMQGGKAVFENDNYRITMGDDNTVTIQNKNTGESYQAWGDPHMNIDGKHEWDFWGTTTLQLEDGTKVTIETTPWEQDKSMTLSSRVTITNGDYGVQVSGIDTNKAGDLRIDEAASWGGVLDAVVRDGNVLHENPAGKGFLAIDDQGRIRAVDQQYINETDLMKGGADRLADRYADAFRLLGSLLSISVVGSFLDGVRGGCDRPDGNGPQRPFDITLCRDDVVRGTAGDDCVHVGKAEGVIGALGFYKVTVNGETQYMTAGQLARTEFKLGDGNDRFTADADVTVGLQVNGGRGNDVIRGGSGDDRINGGAGDDKLRGGRGDDELNGGRGHDIVRGGRGDDVVRGGPGLFDFVFGGPGRDVVRF
jgi:hypothetical protein